MRKEPSDTAAPNPADTHEAIPRTGSGAGTAMIAMLKKRQMRASAEPQPPEESQAKPPQK